jgi:methylmalonyl-CoA mutase N-terminal domain/subunit
MLEAIERGWVQEQIHEAAYRWQREVESGARTIVGVNRFAEEGAPPTPPFRPDASVDRERAAFLAAWRRERDGKAAAAALARLDRAARGSSNLMPSILEALRSHCTLGEVCDVLRGVFGVYHPGGRQT